MVTLCLFLSPLPFKLQVVKQQYLCVLGIVDARQHAQPCSLKLIPVCNLTHVQLQTLPPTSRSQLSKAQITAPSLFPGLHQSQMLM